MSFGILKWSELDLQAVAKYHKLLLELSTADRQS